MRYTTRLTSPLFISSCDTLLTYNGYTNKIDIPTVLLVMGVSYGCACMGCTTSTDNPSQLEL